MINKLIIRVCLLTSLAGFALSMSPANEPRADVMTGRPNAIGSPVQMVEQYCTETSGIPSHVVIRPHGVGDVVYAGKRLTTAALEQEFGNGQTNHQIFAFCK